MCRTPAVPEVNIGAIGILASVNPAAIYVGMINVWPPPDDIGGMDTCKRDSSKGQMVNNNNNDNKKIITIIKYLHSEYP